MKFSIVATFSGYEPTQFCPSLTIRDMARDLAKIPNLQVDIGEPGESEYCYLAKEGRYENPEDDPWFKAQDVTASGILTREEFDDFISATGAFAEDVQTMGTLGGPLAPWGGVVADIVFRTEEEMLIESIRVTPIPCRNGKPMRGDERTWDRVRRAVLSVYSC